MTLLSREKRRELATIVAAVATFKYHKKDGMLSTDEMAAVNMERAEWLVGLCWDAASDFSADMLDIRNEETP